MTDRWDDPELERLMKEGLESRAREVDVDVAVADRARAAAGGVRWRTAAAVGLVAASVAGVVGGVALLRDDDPRSGGAVGEPTTPTVVDKWRTEYWHDIQVDVPADWGWGGSPFTDELNGATEGLLACAAGPFKAPGLSDREIDWQSTPYVGRPFTLTDVCELFRDGQWREPQAPYLWFGTPIEPGIREFDNGYVQETIEFEGEPVTVATDDPSLREQILESVTGGETCYSELEAPPQADVGIEGIGDFTGLTVCAYRRDTLGETLRLAYAAKLPGENAQRLVDALGQDEPSRRACPAGDVYVTLLLDGSDAHGAPVTFTYVADLGGCAAIEDILGHHELREANVAPWNVGGLPTVLFAPWAWDEPWMSDYFIGPQG